MMDYISQEFYAYNKAFLSPLSRIVSNWKIENNGGLSVRVNNTTASLLFASGKTGKEGINLRDAAYTLLTATLADNSVNYVEVQMQSQTCAADTVAIWDTTANAGSGEEFTQTVDTAYEEAPVLVSNTIAFTGDSDKLQLAIVTCSGGVIVSIVDSRKMLFELESDWNFGVTRTDRTIGSLKGAYDAIVTSLKEMKGSTYWYDMPFASNKILKEYQNLFISGGGTIQWEGTAGANTLAWSADFDIEIADRPSPYNIDAGSVTLAEGQAMYVVIPTGVPVISIVPIVANLADVPLDPSSVGYSPNIQVLFFRRNNKIISTTLDIPDLSSGEGSSVGEDLPETIRVRLGINSDTSYVAYTSTSIISVADSYAVAISKLDAQILFMLSATPSEEEFFTVASQTIFNAVSMTWSALSTVPDIIVTVNGQKMRMSPTGALDKDFRKVSSAQIEFAEAIEAGSSVVIWQNVAYGGGGGGGGGSLTVQEEGSSIDAATVQMNFVGSGVTASQISPGIVQVAINTSSAVSLRKLVKNDTGTTIPAFSCLTWKSDGTVELADANIASKALWAGINESAIADGAYGFAIKEGNIANALSTLGASPGDVIYMGENPGELTLTPPIGITDTIFKIGKAEPPDGIAQPNAIDLYLEPEIISSP